MKGLVAILSSALLVGMPFAPVPVATAAACPKHVARQAACGNHCGMAGCCVAQPNPGSQPAPVIPRTGAQNQLSILVPALVVFTLPESPANSISPAATSFLAGADAPLYARHCALLL